MDEELGVHSVLDELLCGLKKLAGEDGDRGGPVSHFFVLGLGDVHEDSGCGVGDIQEMEDGGPVVGDGVVFGSLDHFVHSTGSKGGFDHISHGGTGVDVGDYLISSLRIVGSVPE